MNDEARQSLKRRTAHLKDLIRALRNLCHVHSRGVTLGETPAIRLERLQTYERHIAERDHFMGELHKAESLLNSLDK